ncbi:hypothetical protein DdX_20662 [Ditylenchus destructor]|uniref:Uncharacterized protein n=1 Tax=Ditylenchus destructor TaxID=166010 RepID=A0AAD4MGS6_9BILA|nr:hypothetical protein DdX_20662 [Ditylenchus destructor]
MDQLLSLGGKFVAKKHVDWFGGTYKLEADVPESEKKGDYKLVASSPLYDDVPLEFTVRDSDKSPYKFEHNATITETGMYVKNHDGQIVWHPDPDGAYKWTYL